METWQVKISRQVNNVNIMNPLIKRTTEKVIGHEIRPEDMSIAVIIGDAILEAIKASQYNPNYNLKGGMDVDENTIGNFRVPNTTMEDYATLHQPPVIGRYFNKLCQQ